MPQKWLAKVTMGSAYSFLMALLCVACSREQEEVYQDPYADPNVTVGKNASEQIESADQHDGWYSVRSYECKGKWQDFKEFRNDSFRKRMMVHASTSKESSKRKDGANGG